MDDGVNMPPCIPAQVTPNAWKWPPLWPYTPDYFDRPDETEDGKAFAEARMTPCLEGSAREALVSHYARFLTDDSRVLEIGGWVGEEFISS